MTLVYLLVCALELKQGAATVLNQYPVTKAQYSELTSCETDSECELNLYVACRHKGHRANPDLTGWLETRPAGAL
jgi:hypothetical protein